MNKSQIKKIGISLLTAAVLSSSIFAVPKDPNSFYGSIQVNSKNITDTTLNAYLNGDLQDTIQVKSSYYGEVLNLITLTGEDNDLVEFELISNECQSSSTKINTSYQEGKSIELDLDFTGTNTCNDEPETTTPDTNTGGGSSGGGGSSSGSSGGGSSTNTQSQQQTHENETIELEKVSLGDSSNGNSGSNLRTNSLIQNDQSEISGDVEDIEVITTDKSNNIESDLEIKKEKVKTGLSGNIIAGNKSLAGILALILVIIGFVGWRENKKRNLRNRIAASAASTTNVVSEKTNKTNKTDIESEISDSTDSETKNE